MTAPMDQGARGAHRDEPVVLQSFRAPRPTTNPYLTQLFGGVTALTEVVHFSWPRALFGRFDVFHVHWPEVLLRSERPLGRVGRRVLFALVLLRIRLGGAALVRTIHNTAPHDEGSAGERALISLCDRWTTLWITLLAQTPVPTAAPSVLIPHGHYTDWFRAHPVPEPVPGRVLYFGLVRPYKGVEDLVDAFQGLTNAELSLHVVGSPSDLSIEHAVLEAATADPRIVPTLDYVADADLAAAVGAADLVVLPYHAMHSSGALLLALSLGRRVLVPATPATEDLAREVGDGWVLTYDGPLRGDTLMDALERPHPGGRPDLTARDWGPAAAAHLAAYRMARATAGRHPWRARLMHCGAR